MWKAIEKKKENLKGREGTWSSATCASVQLSEWLKDPAHRVDRVLIFFSSRPNWDLPPPPLVPRGGGDTLACGRGRGGGGGSQFGRGDRHCGTLGYNYFVILPLFFRSESGQNMTAESDCHASGPPPNLKMDLLQAMEDFVRAWLRSESTLCSNCIYKRPFR